MVAPATWIKAHLHAYQNLGSKSIHTCIYQVKNFIHTHVLEKIVEFYKKRVTWE